MSSFVQSELSHVFYMKSGIPPPKTLPFYRKRMPPAVLTVFISRTNVREFAHKKLKIELSYKNKFVLNLYFLFLKIKLKIVISEDFVKLTINEPLWTWIG